MTLTSYHVTTILHSFMLYDVRTLCSWSLINKILRSFAKKKKTMTVLHFQCSILQLDVSSCMKFCLERYIDGATQQIWWYSINFLHVCSPHKAIYGLKQTPHAWFTWLAVSISPWVGFSMLSNGQIFVHISWV
jgi:hypothetical protein